MANPIVPQSIAHGLEGLRGPMLTSVISAIVRCELFAGRITFSVLENADHSSAESAGSWFPSTALSIAALATIEIHIGLHRIRPAAPNPKLGNLTHGFNVT
jgi:hypothetical protein